MDLDQAFGIFKIEHIRLNIKFNIWLPSIRFKVRYIIQYQTLARFAASGKAARPDYAVGGFSTSSLVVVNYLNIVGFGHGKLKKFGPSVYNYQSKTNPFLMY